MNIIKIIISLSIIFSSGYGLLYNFLYNRKKRVNSMWIYYTNVSNLIILIYFLVVVFLFDISKKFNNSIIEYSVMMIILITMLIYHFLLRKNIKDNNKEKSMFFKIKNILLHYITPILVFIYWMCYSENKELLNYITCTYWLLVPLIYIICIIIRAKFINKESDKKRFPYYFFNTEKIGKKKVVLSVFVIICMFILLSESIYKIFNI